MKPQEYEAMATKLDGDAGFVHSKCDPIEAKAERSIDDIFIDTHRNAPKPSEACLYGLVGDIARAGSENTEANAYAVAASAIAYLGVAVGRGPYMTIGDDWNHARLFMVHVGRSSRGRKGTAKKLVVQRIAKAVMEISEHLAPAIHTGGLSTREGLALIIHDGFKEGKDEVPAIEDKRLLVVESEFANILHQKNRDGNTLSTALRDAWDGVSIKPATKTNRVWASDPHVGVLADITPFELVGLMASRELTNGFANRFIFFWAEGDKVNPFPKATPDDVIQSLAKAVAEVLSFAGADRHVERDVFRLELSKDAASHYAKLYRGELRDRSAGERVSGLLDRRAPMLMRLAMIFALTDKTLTIEVPHLEAAMAWVRYWSDSVKFIFQSAMDEVAVAEVNETAKLILEFLKKVDRASRTEISSVRFSRHVSRDKLDKALDELLTATPPLIEVETVPRPQGKTGSPTKFYKSCANSAKSANYEQPRGLQPESVTCDVSELCELSSEHNSQISHDSQTAKPLGTRVDVEVSHNSHNSQPTVETLASNVDDCEVF
jgi:hypothetical protein